MVFVHGGESGEAVDAAADPLQVPLTNQGVHAAVHLGGAARDGADRGFAAEAAYLLEDSADAHALAFIPRSFRRYVPGAMRSA